MPPASRLLPFVFLLGLALRADDVVTLPPWKVEAPPLAVGAADGASSLLGTQRLDLRPAQTLGDALRGTPGLMVLESFGGFEPPRLSMRGSGIQSAPTSRGILMEVDGLPLNLADGSFNAALFDPRLGDRVDVRRGYDAARGDFSVMGGSIDLRHEPPSADDSSFALQGGSRNALAGRLEGDATGPLGSASVLGAWSSQDGSRDHASQHRASGYATASFKGLRVSAYGSTLDYHVPGPLTLAAAMSAPGSVSSDVVRDDPRRASSVARLAVADSWRHDRLQAEAAVAFTRTADDFRQLQANGVTRFASSDLSWKASVSGAIPAAGIANEITARAQGTLGARSQQRYRNDAGKQGAIFGDNSLDAATTMLSVEDSVPLGRTLRMTAGYGRFASRRDIGDRLVPSSALPRTARTCSDDRNLAHATLVWNPAASQALYLAYSETAEAPTFDDLLFVAGTYPALSLRSASLAAQTARTCELGTRGTRGRLDWDLGLYQGQWRHEILRLADAKGLPRGAINAGRTRHQGLESSLRCRLLQGPRRLDVEVMAMWTRCTFQDDPVYHDRVLAGLPPHQGTADLAYEDPCGFFASAGCDWTAGRTYADHAGRLSYGGQTLARIRAGWRLRRGWSVFAAVENVFDRRWIASTAGVLDLARNPAATSLFLPGSGRALTVGFSWKS